MIKPFSSWRVSPDDSRDVEVWNGTGWQFDCCLRTADEAAKGVADNIAELDDINGYRTIT